MATIVDAYPDCLLIEVGLQELAAIVAIAHWFNADPLTDLSDEDVDNFVSLASTIKAHYDILEATEKSQ